VTVRIQLKRAPAHRLAHLPAWIRRADVSKIHGPPDPLAIADIMNHRGDLLGRALYSPDSDIVARVIQRGDHEVADTWLEDNITRALRIRSGFALEDTTGFREINSEGDGLPGLVVDRYGDHRVVQVTTAPMRARIANIEAALRSIDERTATVLVPVGAARKESMEPGCDGPALTELRYREHGLEIRTAAPPSQKTGAYHDQRDNRAHLAKLATGAGGALLDAGCHVGGFSLHAAAAGVECVALDQSEAALKFVEQNVRMNKLSGVVTVRADLFGPLDHPHLRRQFGAIVFDPPKVVSNLRDVRRASKAMERSLAALLPKLRPGGVLAVCSCSHHLGIDALDLCVGRASGSTGVHTARIELRGAGPDHPISPLHAEGHYLTVAIYVRG